MGIYIELVVLLESSFQMDEGTLQDEPHSQKQSGHWAVGVTAQVVPC